MSKKSRVWDFFKGGNDRKARCNICNAEVATSGGTTNLNTHLKRHHHISVASLSLPSSSPSPSTAEIPSSSTRPPAILTPTSTQQATEGSQSITPWTVARQCKLPESRTNAITSAIVYYIIDDMRPFSTIESCAFRNVLKKMDPRYCPPNRQTVSDTLIPALLQQEERKLFVELNKASAVALTSDAWTSRATESYMTITCHYLTEDWTLVSKVLQTEKFHGSHTGQNVGIELDNAMMKWGIKEKVKVITVDNASNMTVAVEVTGVDLKLGCFAHTLNLASNKALTVAALSKVLGKVRSVATYFHKSAIGMEVLREIQKGLKVPKHNLIMDCKTRWNSTYEMLQRFIEQRPAILAALMDEKLKSSATAAKAGSNLSDDEVQRCEQFVETMEIMMTTTLMLSQEKSPTVGLILPLLNKMKTHFSANEEDSTFVKALKEAVLSNLTKRYTDPKLIEFLEEATVLDPRRKRNSCVTESTWVRIVEKCTAILTMGKENSVINIKEEPVEASLDPSLPRLPFTETSEENSVAVKNDPPKSALSVLFDDVEITDVQAPLPPAERAAKEVLKYRDAEQISVTWSPLSYWKDHEAEFPSLAVLAKKYLCVQATSVASERVFSTTGDIVTATRACLSSENVHALVFLKKNMKMPT